MKKILFATALCIAASINLIGQSNFNFYQSSWGGYVSLSNPTILNFSDLNQGLFDEVWELPLRFNYMNVYDTLYVSPQGVLVMFKIDDVPIQLSTYSFGKDVIFDKDYDTDSLNSRIQFEIDSSGQDKIFKLEYLNYGLSETTAVPMDSLIGTQEDTIGFQIWLYESTNCMEIRFGHTLIMNESLMFSKNDTSLLGPMIVLQEASSCLSLDGNPSFANINNQDPCNHGSVIPIDTIPELGTIYSFCPGTNLSLVENSSSGLDIYPNPVNDILYINEFVAGQKATITDLSGKVVLTSQSSNIDVMNLPAGIYIINISSDEIGMPVKKAKFIKE